MDDLILKYQFTDRGGRSVMNIHSYAERKVGPILGQIRLDRGRDVTATHLVLDWADVVTEPMDPEDIS